MIKQECIGIPDMILLLMIFLFQKIKIKAEIVLSPGGAYFHKYVLYYVVMHQWKGYCQLLGMSSVQNNLDFSEM